MKRQIWCCKLTQVAQPQRRCNTGCNAVWPANEESGEPKLPVPPPLYIRSPLTAEPPFWPVKLSTPLQTWDHQVDLRLILCFGAAKVSLSWGEPAIQLAGLLSNNGRLRNFQLWRDDLTAPAGLSTMMAVGLAGGLIVSFGPPSFSCCAGDGMIFFLRWER